MNTETRPSFTGILAPLALACLLGASGVALGLAGSRPTLADVSGGPEQRRNDTVADATNGPEQRRGDLFADGNAGPEQRRGDLFAEAVGGPEQRMGVASNENGPEHRRNDTVAMRGGTSLG